MDGPISDLPFLQLVPNWGQEWGQPCPSASQGATECGLLISKSGADGGTRTPDQRFTKPWAPR